MFLVLVKNITTHDLDENGKSVPEHLVIDNGIHSMKYMQQSLLERHGMRAYHGKLLLLLLLLKSYNYLNI